MPNEFHSLLASSTEESLLVNLNLKESEKGFLVDANKEIRKVITEGFIRLREQVKLKNLDFQVPKPKFAIQGSFVYGTMNAPAYPPEQQVDIDLGVYLPFSALGDGEKPKEATSFYFDEVTQILKRYIDDNPSRGWSLPPLELQKDTCIRVILSDTMHIDLPLYAVPEEKFSDVSDSINKSESLALNFQDDDFYLALNSNDNNVLMEAATLDRVDPSVIYMADREKGWEPSDALVIRDWVKGHFGIRGNMIAPVNRFLKGWRDEVWREGGGPNSILLLSHTINSFPENFDGLNHCNVLEAVINELPNLFNTAQVVPCPTSDDKDNLEDLRDRVSLDKQIEYTNNFAQLKTDYHSAKMNYPTSANRTLVELFGERMPFAPNRITVTDKEKAVSAAIIVSKPDVKTLRTTERSNSGCR